MAPSKEHRRRERARRRARPRGRAGWTVLTIAALAWAVGPLAPGLRDSLDLTATLGAFLTLVVFLPGRRKTSRLTRAALDGAIVGAALVFLAWATVLAPGAERPGTSSTLLAVDSVAAIVLASLALLVVARAPTARRTPALAMASGLVALAGGAIAPTLSLDLAQISGAAVALRAIGFVFVLIGFLGRPDLDDDRTSPMVAAVPAMPVILALGAAARWLMTGSYLQPVVVFAGLAIVLLLLGRQFLSILDGRSMARDLEATVVARTAELAKSEVRFRSLVQSSSDVITILDQDGMILFVTPSAERVFGFQPDDLVDRSIWQFLHPEDLDRGRAALSEARVRPDPISIEWRLRTSAGEWAECETIVRSLLDEPSIAGIVLNTRDVSERKSLEEQLMREALHDPLTGLANRALLRDRITHGLARNRRSGGDLALLLIDLDDFKAVNDGLGHAAGDEVLTVVARRLLQCVRPGDTVARLGGDEFAVLLEADADDEAAQRVGDRILELIKTPLYVMGHEVFTPASIGIASLSSGPCHDADELVRNADVAMYIAKGRGKSQMARFAPEMHTEMRERLTLATELRRAVGRGEFSLRYQPVVDLKTSRVVGVEALVRWYHPTRGLVMPGEFIETAETTGVIVPLGRWVLAQALEDLARWQAMQRPGERPFYVTVNLSGRQFQEPNIVADLAAVIAESGVPAASVVLELTETVLMDDIEGGIERLRAMKSLGVQLALDDFGTGYSSLSYLRRFPIDILKIDRSFITALHTIEGPGMVRSILRLGDTFRLNTLAEGIEEPEQLSMLRALGCTYGQGFLFSAPVPRHQINDLVAAQSKEHALV